MIRHSIIVAMISLALISIATSSYALWAHRALRRAQDERSKLLNVLQSSNGEVREFVCEGIDGIDCYRVMTEYRLKGIDAAVELRSEVSRSVH